MLLTVTITLGGTACVSDVAGVDTAARYRLPTLSEQSPVDTFDAYRQSVGQWLATRSMAHRSPDEIALNLPFERSADPNVAYQGRFLLFHGLNDSAYVWQPLAVELSQRGFDVRAILFDGHGSTPEHMLNVRWQWWMDSAREHLAAIQADDVPVYLGGFSMGAVVATWLALDNPSIAGLLLISPAFESRLNHYLRWSGVYARFKPWVFGGMILEDNPIKYNSIPVNSGWQYYQLTRALKRRWNRSDRVAMPTLMVMTEDDSVVNAQYTRELFVRRFDAPESRLLSYTTRPSAMTGEWAGKNQRLERHTQNRIVFRSASYPSRRILNQSHLGLMYPPDNRLFGEDGLILVCNGNEYPVFMACMRSQRHWFGAQHTPSPDGIAVARTTYNPDWQGMIGLMERVLIRDHRGSIDAH